MIKLLQTKFHSILVSDNALCGGVDRHPNNWEVMVVDGRLDLVPSFDHGSSLGGNLSESTRSIIAASGFAPNLIKSAFWNDTERIDPIQAFEIAARLYPQAIWQRQLARITPTQINDIFDRLPNERITSASREFAINLVEFNRQKLVSICEKLLSESMAEASTTGEVMIREAQSSESLDG